VLIFSLLLVIFFYHLLLKETQLYLLLQLKEKPGQNWDTATDENHKEEDMSQDYSITETSSDKENKSEAQFQEQKIDKVESTDIDQTMFNESNKLAQDDISDEGWQEAVPKGRSLIGRKSSSSRRPTLAKLNTNFMSASQSPRYRGKPANFSSPRSNLNETSVGSSLPVSKKFVKSSSFSPKLNNSNTPTAGVEKLADTKSAPASPALSDQIAKPALVSGGVALQSTSKLFSYKEVALAPPGTIVKAVAEHPSKGNLNERNSEVSPIIIATNEIHGNVASSNDIEDKVHDSIDEKPQESFYVEEKETEVVAVTNNTKTLKRNEVRKPREANNDGVVERNVEVGNITVIEVEKSDCLNSGTNATSNGSSEIDAHTTLIISVESKTQLDGNDVSLSKDMVTEGDEKQLDFPQPSDGEKKEEIETGKEPTKKLSASAPPFNPSTIPIFGSVPVPGFNDHVGILPPPVNISPLLPRRSLHQSATSRVPYGPRISGGYNRHYGNRVPRNKNVFPSSDGNPNSPPTIMNPHATEFVPGQTWVPPNEYMASPNSILVSPNSSPPVSPNDNIPPNSLNDTPVNQNEFATSPCSNDSAQVEIILQNKKVVDDQVTEALSIQVNSEKQPVPQQDPPPSNENCCPRQEEKDIYLSHPIEDEAASKDAVDKVKPDKCWGDYSDNEVDTNGVIG